MSKLYLAPSKEKSVWQKHYGFIYAFKSSHGHIKSKGDFLFRFASLGNSHIFFPFLKLGRGIGL